MILKGESWSTWRETQLRATLATTNPTQNGSRSNSGLCVGMGRLTTWVMARRWSTRNVKERFFNMIADIWKKTAFFKRSQIRPLVVLISAAYRRRWVWSSGWMILTGENQNTRRKTCSSATWPPQISHFLSHSEQCTGHCKNAVRVGPLA